MIVRLTEADAAEARRLAEEKLANAERLGTPHINRFRDDRIQGYVEGYLGEWAVADALGVARAPDTSGTADSGSDVTVGDVRLNVRFTRHQQGRLMCPANRPFHDCEWAVLVVGAGDPLALRIVGGVTLARFYEEAKRDDFGYGETDWMAQGDLTPWGEVVGLLPVAPPAPNGPQPRTRQNRLPRRHIVCKGVGRDEMLLTCPRCGWPCEYLVRAYYDSPWNTYGGFCGECVLEANRRFQRQGWPEDPLAPQVEDVDPDAYEGPATLFGE